MVISVWFVPRATLAGAPPRAVTVLGRVPVATAWVRYDPRGVLAYRAVMAALLVWHRRHLHVTVPHIWVDSPASQVGGRALWGIPKELAVFTERPGTSTRPETARDAGGTHLHARDATRTDATRTIVAAAVSRGQRLPGRWPVRFRVVQDLDGQPRVSPVRLAGRLALHRSRWDPAAEGPLGFLTGLRPRLTVRLDDFRMIFGAGAGAGRDGIPRPARRARRGACREAQPPRRPA